MGQRGMRGGLGHPLGPPRYPGRDACASEQPGPDAPFEQDVLARLLGWAKRPSIRFVEHLTGDGPTVFEHVCGMGLEGIVSKRTDAPYRSGRSRTWLKSKNPANAAVRREREEEWR